MVCFRCHPRILEDAGSCAHSRLARALGHGPLLLGLGQAERMSQAPGQPEKIHAPHRGPLPVPSLPALHLRVPHLPDDCFCGRAGGPLVQRACDLRTGVCGGESGGDGGWHTAMVRAKVWRGSGGIPLDHDTVCILGRPFFLTLRNAKMTRLPHHYRLRNMPILLAALDT